MADQKLTALTSLATLTADDIFYVVDDPAGVPAQRKVAASVIATYVNTTLDADLISWAAVTRASGFDTFAATPSGANLASLLTTALPASKGGTGLTSLGTGVATWLGTPTSANLATAVTDALGTGKLIFSAGTLAVASGKTLTVSNTLTFTGTDSSSVAFGAGGTVLYTTNISDTAYASSWDADTTNAPSKNAVYDKLENLVHPALVTATWELAFTMSQNFTVSGPASNTIYYWPFILWRRTTISDMGCRVNGTASGGKFALAIYAHSASTGRPTGTPLAATGDLSTTAAGQITGDITGANVTLGPGLYWGALWADATAAASATLNCSGAATSPLLAMLAGSTTAATTYGDRLTLTALSSAETYNSSAWPDAGSETMTEIALASRVYQLIYKVV